MELKKAVELQVMHYGQDGTIRVDVNGYLCLNDLHKYYPNKDMSNWMRSPSTIELIKAIDDKSNSVDSTELKPSVIAKRGRHHSGTWAHELVAMDFAAWLSVEFKIQVYQAFINGTQRKENWNIKRILAANNFKLMTDAIKADHDTPKPYHFSNEALMLNEIVFGVRDGNVRDTATEEQLDYMAILEGYNAGFIEAGMDYQTRKKTLSDIVARKNAPKKLTQE